MSHYSLAHSPVSLSKWSRAIAKELAARYGEGSTRYPVFCYRGLSGTATATALMLALNSCRAFKSPYAMMYSRKETEESHGDALAEFTFIGQTPPAELTPEFVFVDDAISSGATMAECANAFQRHFQTTLVLTNDNITVLTGFNGSYDPDAKYSEYTKLGEYGYFTQERVNRYLERAAAEKYATYKVLLPIMHKERNVDG